MSLFNNKVLDVAAYDSLIQGIATHLGWEVGSHNEKVGGKYKYLMFGKYEIIIYPFEERGKEKLQVEGVLDYFEKNISFGAGMNIFISAEKSPVVIAKEIQRRLLQDYIPLLDSRIEEHCRKQAELAIDNEFAKTMAAKLGITISDTNRGSGFLKPNQKGIYIKELIFNKIDSTEIKIRNLTAIQTEALIEALLKIKDL